MSEKSTPIFNYSDIVKFNIGGTIFSTYISTITKKILKPNSSELYAPNLLERLLKDEEKYDENRAIFIDRNPQHFNHMLDFLRLVNKYKLPTDEDLINRIYEEAEFYQIEALIDVILPFSGSTILTSKNAKKLTELCGFSVPEKWMLLYRGDTEGLKVKGEKSFHAKFTGIPRTMIVAKSNGGSSIFGCYTEKGWNSKSDTSSFLFSLISNDDVDFSFLNASNIEIYTRNIPNIIRV